MTVQASLGYFHGNRFATYGPYRIISAFQPIYSIAHRRIVGLEGLARGLDSDDRLIPPVQLFSHPERERVINLDKLCQQVHIDNFYALSPPNAWLFLNVDPLTLSQQEEVGSTHESYLTFLSQLIREKSFPPNRFVIEILESTIDDELLLEQQIHEYRKLGFLIAIDDFGAGHSNFERIWRIKPDIVKLDRSMMQKAGIDQSVKNLMKGITSMLHNCKCIVLAEGVETEQEAIAAMDAQVDLVQGYYFAKPFLLSEPINTRNELWKNLYTRFDLLSHLSSSRRDSFIAPYISTFRELFPAGKPAADLVSLGNSMFALENTLRLYQLTPDGNQLFSNLDSPSIHVPGKARLKALSDTQGASWKRREYFINAVNNPGNIQVTAPYFSISDGILCVTLSIATMIDDRQYIICCDVLCDQD